MSPVFVRRIFAALLCSFSLSSFSLAQNRPAAPQSKPPAPSTQQQQTAGKPTPAVAVPSPQSKHYPILLIASGTEPFWSLKLGMKGPQELDRVGYPDIPLEPGAVDIDR